MSPDTAISDPARGSPVAHVSTGVLGAVSRVCEVGADLGGSEAVGSRLVIEARELFGVTRAVLLCVGHDRATARPVALSPGAEPGGDPVDLARFEWLSRVVTGDLGHAVAQGAEAARLDRELGSESPARTVLAMPLRAAGRVAHVLVLCDARGREFGSGEIDVAAALATAAGAGLAQAGLAEAQAGRGSQQAALARAAKTLGESLDLKRVLVRICCEAASILDGDNAAVYRGNGSDGITVEATYGLPPEAIGYRMAPGSGLAGKVAELDEPLLTNDYESLAHPPDANLFGKVRSGIAVPMHWDGELRGVLAVGYESDQRVTADHLGVLEAFGELAAGACRNASAHAGLAQAARTDGLTGCLNHAAMHDALQREIERCERTGHQLSLVLIDMDDFKQVNEEHGHLMGDEVLRRVGRALRQAVRPYDLVARYGGDEFAIVAVESGEPATAELASRALSEVARGLEDLEGAAAAGGASAGIAEWSSGDTTTGLIELADRALLYGKQEQGEGSAVTASALPDDYRPRVERPAQKATPVAESDSEDSPAWPGLERDERLSRRARQLALANLLGTRLVGMTDQAEILRLAVAEMGRGLELPRADIVRLDADGRVALAASGGEPFACDAAGWTRPSAASLVGRCLAERVPAASTQGSSELAAPLWVAEQLWGAVAVRDPRPEAFDEDDERLLATVAGQIGSALGAAALYERLEQAYFGTAEAVASAVEAQDSYGAAHSRAVVHWAQEVGARLGLDAHELRMLRFAAIFRDIGKINVPDRILNKREPLTPLERRAIERHTLEGEQILSRVELLEEALPLLRHEHERWDGRGYPDGLRGEDIPLGSRIILACDAYSAMISDRPYRPAMTRDEAGAELAAGAGKQFDERVVAALLELLEGPAQPEVSSAR